MVHTSDENMVDTPKILDKTAVNNSKSRPSSSNVLIASKVSGRYSENKNFQRILPASSCLPQNASTRCIYQDRFSIVLDKKNDSLSVVIQNVIGF